MISPREIFPALRQPVPGLPDFSCPTLLCTFRSCVCYLDQVARGQREKSNRGSSHSWILNSSGQREGFSFLSILGICLAIVCCLCAKVALTRGLAKRGGKIPKGFPPSFLTHDRPFSCSSDRKERASLGAFSVSTCSVLRNFRLPLSSGWETFDLKKRETHHQVSGSQGLLVFLNLPVAFPLEDLR